MKGLPGWWEGGSTQGQYWGSDGRVAAKLKGVETGKGTRLVVGRKIINKWVGGRRGGKGGDEEAWKE